MLLTSLWLASLLGLIVGPFAQTFICKTTFYLFFENEISTFTQVISGWLELARSYFSQNHVERKDQLLLVAVSVEC